MFLYGIHPMGRRFGQLCVCKSDETCHIGCQTGKTEQIPAAVNEQSQPAVTSGRPSNFDFGLESLSAIITKGLAGAAAGAAIGAALFPVRLREALSAPLY